jgi:hypothetical protein
MPPLAETGLSASIIGTSLTSSGPVTHRGFVDLIDCLQGVRGWALDLAAPDQPVMLELHVGDVVLAEVTPDSLRRDISDALGMDVPTGFTFDPACLALVAELAESMDDPVGVRIAGTDLSLGMGDTPPRAEDIIDRLRTLSAPAQPKRRQGAADFELLLDDLRAGAVPLIDQDLRAYPETLQGYIETLALDTSGQVWIVGWMKRGHFTEFSAVIHERRAVPAAVAVMTYARDDLPQDACGVIGVLSSSWRPTSATSEFTVFFGAGGRYHLRAHIPLRLITPPELVAEYEGVRERCLGEGRAIALQRMLMSLESWMPTRAAAQTYATETSVDRILLVPGLGCLAEGWALSPLLRVESLRLRIGGAVMTAHPEATYWKPRMDLLPAFPGSERLVQRAGFVTLFTGDADPDDFTDPVLKLVFEGGTSANWPVSAKVFRRLGHSATIEDALLFFPALQEEAFFPRFAEAAIRAERGAMTPPVAMQIAHTPRAVVIVLPDDRCDLFLLFEELSQQCRTGGGLEGVALVASSQSNRSDAMWMFQEFQRSVPVAASLLVIDESANGLALLPDILRAIGATRFAFVGAGLFLTESGWRQVRDILHFGSQDLTFFGLSPDDFEQRDSDGGLTARCFAWTTAQFLRWAAHANSFLGGYYRDNGMLHARVPHVVHEDAARNSRWAMPTRIQEAVNSAVYGMGARR